MSYQYTLDYSVPINADVLRITFDGVTYECQKNIDEGLVYYGAPRSETLQDIDFSEYPFALRSGLSNLLYTENDGEHTISVEVVTTTAEVSDCFRTAVESVSGGGASPLIVQVDNDPEETNGSTTSIMDTTYETIADAYNSGRPIIVRSQGTNSVKEWSVISIANGSGSTPIALNATKPTSGSYIVTIVGTNNLGTDLGNNGKEAIIYRYITTATNGYPTYNADSPSNVFHKTGCLQIDIASGYIQASGYISHPSGYKACIVSVYAERTNGDKAIVDWVTTETTSSTEVTVSIAQSINTALTVYVHYHLDVRQSR